jgi:hypothetical protein
MGETGILSSRSPGQDQLALLFGRAGLNQISN